MNLDKHVFSHPYLPWKFQTWSILRHISNFQIYPVIIKTPCKTTIGKAVLTCHKYWRVLQTVLVEKRLSVFWNLPKGQGWGSVPTIVVLVLLHIVALAFIAIITLIMVALISTPILDAALEDVMDMDVMDPVAPGLKTKKIKILRFSYLALFQGCRESL